MKLKCRLLIVAALALMVSLAVLGNPYPRQFLLGPKIQGVPLCAWQENFRGHFQAVAPRRDSFITKFLAWLRNGPTQHERLRPDHLSPAERDAICLSLVDDPSARVRRAVPCALAAEQPTNNWFNQVPPVAAAATSEDAFAALVHLLDDPDEWVRDRAARYIDPYRTAADRPVERVKALLTHDDPHRRALAVNILGRCPIRKEAMEDAVTVSARMLDDPDAKVRAAAAKQLQAPFLAKRRAAQVAALKLAAVPKLSECLLDPNLLCRIEAARALWNLGHQQADIVPAFRAALTGPKEDIRLVALDHLQNVSAICPRLWDELLHCATKDELVGIRTMAIAPLSSCGPRAVPVLIDVVANRKAGQFKALEALGRLGCEDDRVVRFLVAQLGREDQRLPRERIVEAIGESGHKARVALPVLLDLLTQNESGDLREKTAIALGKIARDDASVAEKLVPLLSTDVYTALQGLLYAGANAKEAAPRLVELLQSWPSSERPWMVIDVLGNIGPEAKAAVPELLRKLRDSDADDAYRIISALGQIGHNAAAVVPALFPYLYYRSEPHVHVRGVAAKALARFGPDARAAIPALTTLLDDDDLELAEAAAAALTAIDPVRYPKR